MVIEDEEAFFCNGYGIYYKNESANSLSLFQADINLLSNENTILELQKILNSNIMHYYVSKTSVSIEGGFPCYQKNFIEKFNIPLFDGEEIRELRNLEYKDEIDEFLITKYQLNLSVQNLNE